MFEQPIKDLIYEMDETNKYSTNISLTSMPQSLQIVWKITDFFSLPEAPSDYRLESPPFILGNGKWCIRFYPNRKLGADYALVRLNSLVNYHEIILIFCIESNKKYFHHQYDNLLYETDCRKRSRELLPTKTEFFDKRLVLAPDGNLTLVWHILCEETERNVFSKKVSHKVDCRMISNESNLSLLSMPQSLQIYWTIPDFSSLPEDPENYKVESPPFFFANAKWCIWFYPNRMEGVDYTLVRLDSLLPCHDIILVSCIDSNKKNYHLKYEKFIFEVDCETRNFGYLPKNTKSLGKRHELKPDDSLTLMCHIFCEESLKNVCSPKVLPKVDSKLNTLSENYKDLFLNKESCDMTLCMKNTEFKVHKAVLIARSSVFAAMFQQEMSEKQTQSIDIPDLDPSSFKEFLQYLYCGQLEELSFHRAFHLYEASDKYYVQELKTLCHKFLLENLTPENVCEVLMLADKCDNIELLSAAQDIFNENISNIFQSSEWECLMKNNYLLANKLLKQLPKMKVLK